MRTFIALAAMSLLTACSGNSDQPAPPTEDVAAAAPEPVASEQGVAPGTYDVKGADGGTGTTVINADGTYVETDFQGNENRGAYARRGDTDCFDPDGDVGEICWTLQPTAADGSFSATSADGKTTVTVSPHKS